MKTDILISGAGPTGLTLAIELGRRGVPHLIIDRNPEPAPGSRGKGLQPRSLEVLHDLGVIDEIRAHGTTGLPLRLYQGHELSVELATASAKEPRPDVPYPDLVLLPEWRVEAILRDRLAELGGKVVFGAELTGFEQDEDGVTATLSTGEQVRARYLVGCDGGHSTVRRALGLSMDGRTHDDQYFLVGDVTVDGLADDAAHAWFGPDGAYLALSPLPHAGGAWQYQANVVPGQDGTVPEPTLDIFRRLFAERSGRADVTLREATWLSRYRFNARMVGSYRQGRVFLAGDAAHVHSPAGGQGMNTGIQDSYNLGWKLAAVLGGAPESLLDSYGAERIPVAAHVLASSSRGFESVFALTGLRRFLRDHLIFPLVKLPAVMARLLARTNQLDIHYPDSPITLPATGHGPRPGDRLPDARTTTVDGAPVRLFDLLRGTHWTILGIGAQATADATDDLHVHALAALPGCRPGTFLLVRPDGYLAARATDPNVLTRHLDSLLTAGV
ncbi:FAD-dependent monooxygenase [Nonomuraea angiospora]